jgi:hypothetical protein
VGITIADATTYRKKRISYSPRSAGYRTHTIALEVIHVIGQTVDVRMTHRGSKKLLAPLVGADGWARLFLDHITRLTCQSSNVKK